MMSDGFFGAFSRRWQKSLLQRHAKELCFGRFIRNSRSSENSNPRWNKIGIQKARAHISPGQKSRRCLCRRTIQENQCGIRCPWWWNKTSAIRFFQCNRLLLRTRSTNIIRKQLLERCRVRSKYAKQIRRPVQPMVQLCTASGSKRKSNLYILLKKHIRATDKNSRHRVYISEPCNHAPCAFVFPLFNFPISVWTNSVHRSTVPRSNGNNPWTKEIAVRIMQCIPKIKSRTGRKQ